MVAWTHPAPAVPAALPKPRTWPAAPAKASKPSRRRRLPTSFTAAVSSAYRAAALDPAAGAASLAASRQAAMAWRNASSRGASWPAGSVLVAASGVTSACTAADSTSLPTAGCTAPAAAW